MIESLSNLSKRVLRPLSLVALLTTLSGCRVDIKTSISEVPPDNVIILDGIKEPPAEITKEATTFAKGHAAWPVPEWTKRLHHETGMLVVEYSGDRNQLYWLTEPGSTLEQLTFDQAGVSTGFFHNGQLIYLGGESEFFQLMKKDPDSQSPATPLTQQGANITHLRMSPDQSKLAFEQQMGDSSSTNVCIFDLNTLKQTCPLGGEGYWFPMAWSPGGDQLISQHFISGNRRDIFVCNSTNDNEKDNYQCTQLNLPPDNLYSEWVFGSNDELFCISNQDNPNEGTMHIYRYNDDTSFEQVTDDSAGDAVELRASGDGNLIAWSQIHAGAYELHLYNSLTRKEIPLPNNLPQGIVYPKGFRPSSDDVNYELALSVSTPVSPYNTYSIVIDLTTSNVQLKQWTHIQAPNTPETEIELIYITSFDGLQVPTWIISPKEPSGKVIMFIHGGPRAMYYLQYSQVMTLLLKQGITVVAPQVRGSDGFGTEYRNLDNGLLRLHAVEDVLAVAEWITTNLSNGNGIAVWGQSAGSLLAYLGASRQPNTDIKCGIAEAGIADMRSFVKTQQQFRTEREDEYGNFFTRQGAKELKAVNPIIHPPTVPFVTIHGTDDPRVLPDQSADMIAAMRRQGTPAGGVFVVSGHLSDVGDYNIWRNAIISHLVENCLSDDPNWAQNFFISGRQVITKEK